MSKPVTPQDMFDLWQKMVNPGAFPLQSLMFPVLDAKEIEKKIGELETVEHWLKANLGMLQLSIKSLEYQRSLLKSGEKARASIEAGGEGDTSNPAMWAWNMMHEAQRAAMESAVPREPAEKKPSGPKRRSAKS